MASGHVGVQGVDSISSAHLTVLLVHVVCAGSRVVSDPDTEVLDLEGVLLRDLNECQMAFHAIFPALCTYHLDADDLTGGLLDLLETSQEVPVSGLGDSRVGSEDGHSVEGRGGVGLGGQVAPDDLEFLKTT